MALDELHKHPLFSTRPEFLETNDRIKLAYQRAQLILQNWGLTLNDIGRCTPKFWEVQSDPIFVYDPAVSSIIACTVNLFIGSLAPLVRKHPYLKAVVDDALSGRIFGNLLLSEVGHGLDMLNLETTATKVDGGFVLHTPNSAATKFMPPTAPIDGIPKVAIVMARVLVDGENRGIHPFFVQTSDNRGMCSGISSACLPQRSGGSPLDYAMTTFDHVQLPETSFLGSSLEKPANEQMLLQSYVWRIPIGTALASIYVSHAAKFVACVGADYSLRRHIQGRGAERVPIIVFRTQQLPVLYATAVAHVLDAWRRQFVQYQMAANQDPRSKYGLSVVFKATVNRLVTMVARNMAERLGAQGLFGHNVISQLEMDNRGMAIAEGDIVVVCIRVFSEVLQERCQLPAPTHPEGLLSKHYAGILSRCSTLVATFPKGHRDPRFSSLILPQCESALLALGYALAHSAAADAGVPQPLLDLFEVGMIAQDAVWFSENANFSDQERMLAEDRAVQLALPHLKEYIDAMDVRKYITAPIVSDSAWSEWEKQLEWSSGDLPSARL
ncbi:hypothetical protein EIP91_005606 [Steccherinum ochraceum]|uniref:Acyl-coenzyme A oxidase n=1 Tax=Steccherinum ochraceum TaxID=92696 RepID=A0A4R0RD18_9APHY|nr:hypothetical protein EIP91_005606 [Steccherinum ochraceum]